MATLNVAASVVTSGNVSLIANDVLVVNFADRISNAMIYTDGTADIWYTSNGSTPVVNQCRRLAAGLQGWTTVVVTHSGSTNMSNSVRLLSAGTPVVTVQVQ